MSSKEKRSISILTVFLWIILIMVMTVITLNGINKNNALEEGEKRKITIKVDFTKYFENEGITSQGDKTYFIKICKTNNIKESGILYYAKYIENEENIGIYEAEIEQDAKYIGYHSTEVRIGKYNLESKNNIIEYIDCGDSICYGEKIKEDQDIYEVNIVEKEKA